MSFADVAEKNVQHVISVRNKITGDVTWFNSARKTKPQTFKPGSGALGASSLDPTGGGGPHACDFCAWETLTAEDEFGRIEGPHCVSASNLFKYAAPSQGVIIFKNLHDPLCSSLAYVKDLLDVASRWFKAASAEHASSKSKTKQHANAATGGALLHPLLVWNCLPRAGASQFHGHAQVMLSATPLPVQQRESLACDAYAVEYDFSDYYEDIVAAHETLGLAVRFPQISPLRPIHSATAAAAVAYASLCPVKDAEIVVHGSSLHCPAFQTLVFAALRALIDELGVCSFNAGIHNIVLLDDDEGPRLGERGASRENERRSAKPVVARIVSRGKIGNVASDFGGLEVFTGASIGHTDPFQVKAALEAVLENGCCKS